MNRFPRVMAVRLGYDPEQVDDFVRRIERTLGLGPLDGPPVTADEIRNAKFAVKLGGYNETAVDFALDAFIVAVEARAGRDAAVPAVPPPAASDSVVKEPVTTEPVTTEPVAHEPRPVAARAPAAPASRTRAEERTRPQAAPAQATGRVEKTGTPPPEPGTPSWLETQAARVERVAFRPGRLGMGYREEEVDAFLDRVVATLRGTAAEPLTPEQVRKATFATVVFRPGYAIHEVDGFLAEMASVLERCP
ncbi:DivIVA domain-containing protein [Microbispora sp. GKU 823]|uniref:DivIVA domain-containing protein n=1 Tax=Microbispora sp. GKU 823 TaxID=1652100 RepID=UPI0015C454EB|nr:DivIVA domain-containing protein [Microbispora sp. GKU 823]